MPEGPAQLVVLVAGLFDAQKEVERLTKQQQKIEKELAGLQGRLSNPKFVEKAKPGVVEEVRQQQVRGLASCSCLSAGPFLL